MAQPTKITVFSQDKFKEMGYMPIVHPDGYIYFDKGAKAGSSSQDDVQVTKEIKQEQVFYEMAPIETDMPCDRQEVNPNEQETPAKEVILEGSLWLREVIHDEHKDVWISELNGLGYTSCIFNQCNFISLSLPIMMNHYRVCNKTPAYDRNLCSLCQCWLASASEFSRHSVVCKGQIFRDRRRTINEPLMESKPTRKTNETFTYSKEKAPIPEQITPPPIVQTTPPVPQGQYLRRRPYAPHHLSSWKIKFAELKYITCHFKSCSFIALSVADMISHFGLCNGNSSFAAFRCSICKGCVTSQALLKHHVATSHSAMESLPKKRSVPLILARSAARNIINKPKTSENTIQATSTATTTNQYRATSSRPSEATLAQDDVGEVHKIVSPNTSGNRSSQAIDKNNLLFKIRREFNQNFMKTPSKAASCVTSEKFNEVCRPFKVAVSQSCNAVMSETVDEFSNSESITLYQPKITTALTASNEDSPVCNKLINSLLWRKSTPGPPLAPECKTRKSVIIETKQYYPNKPMASISSIPKSDREKKENPTAVIKSAIDNDKTNPKVNHAIIADSSNARTTQLDIQTHKLREGSETKNLSLEKDVAAKSIVVKENIMARDGIDRKELAGGSQEKAAIVSSRRRSSRKDHFPGELVLVDKEKSTEGHPSLFQGKTAITKIPTGEPDSKVGARGKSIPTRGTRSKSSTYEEKTSIANATKDESSLLEVGTMGTVSAQVESSHRKQNRVRSKLTSNESGLTEGNIVGTSCKPTTTKSTRSTENESHTEGKASKTKETKAEPTFSGAVSTQVESNKAKSQSCRTKPSKKEARLEGKGDSTKQNVTKDEPTSTEEKTSKSTSEGGSTTCKSTKVEPGSLTGKSKTNEKSQDVPTSTEKITPSVKSKYNYEVENVISKSSKKEENNKTNQNKAVRSTRRCSSQISKTTTDSPCSKKEKSDILVNETHPLKMRRQSARGSKPNKKYDVSLDDKPQSEQQLAETAPVRGKSVRARDDDKVMEPTAKAIDSHKESPDISENNEQTRTNLLEPKTAQLPKRRKSAKDTSCMKEESQHPTNVNHSQKPGLDLVLNIPNEQPVPASEDGKVVHPSPNIDDSHKESPEMSENKSEPIRKNLSESKTVQKRRKRARDSGLIEDTQHPPELSHSQTPDPDVDLNIAKEQPISALEAKILVQEEVAQLPKRGKSNQINVKSALPNEKQFEKKQIRVGRAMKRKETFIIEDEDVSPNNVGRKRRCRLADDAEGQEPLPEEPEVHSTVDNIGKISETKKEGGNTKKEKKCVISDSDDETISNLKEKVVSQKVKGQMAVAKRGGKPGLTPSKVMCGKCEAVVTRKSWDTHNAMNHAGLGWNSDETPYDIEKADSQETLERIRSAFRTCRAATCEKCGETKKSFMGFHSHIMFCGKTSEERNESMVKCKECGKPVLPYSMYAHMRSHSGAPDIIIPTSRKRQSAVKALSTIKEAIATEGNAFIEFTLGDALPDLLRKYRKSPKGSRKRCNREGCDVTFEEKSADGFRHLFTCSTLPLTFYYCVECFCVTETQLRTSQHSCEGCEEKEGNDMPAECDGEPEEYNVSTDDDDDHARDISDKREQKRMKRKLNESNIPIISQDEVHLRRVFMSQEGLNARGAAMDMFKLAYKWEHERQALHITKDDYPELVTSARDWKKIEKPLLDRYLPPLSQSLPVIYDSVEGSSHIGPILALQSSSHKGFAGGFAGGPIQTFAWCPVILSRSGVVDQYIALSCSSQVDDYPSIRGRATDTALLQIWNVGKLTNNVENSNIRMAVGVALDYGELWDVAWCPDDLWREASEGTLPRLGLIATATHDGIPRIFSISCPPSGDSVPVFKVAPLVELHHHTDIVDDACLRLSWGDDGYICAGYSSGRVTLWNMVALKTSSVVKNNSAYKIYPIKTFHAHICPITSVALCPGKPQVLATGARDKKIHFWDLKNVQAPTQSESGWSSRHLQWIKNRPALCCLGEEENEFDILLPRCFHTSRLRHRTESTIQSLSFCDWSFLSALGTGAGEVTIRSNFDPYCRWYPWRSQLTVAATLTLSPDKPLSSYEEALDSGVNIVFTDKVVKKFPSQWDNKTRPEAGLSEYNLASTELVAINPNHRTFHNIGVGYRCGVFRILNLDITKNIDGSLV